MKTKYFPGVEININKIKKFVGDDEITISLAVIETHRQMYEFQFVQDNLNYNFLAHRNMAHPEFWHTQYYAHIGISKEAMKKNTGCDDEILLGQIVARTHEQMNQAGIEIEYPSWAMISGVVAEFDWKDKIGSGLYEPGSWIPTTTQQYPFYQWDDDSQTWKDGWETNTTYISGCTFQGNSWLFDNITMTT